ncbi:PREDICTED: transmembrane protein 205, partial [Cyprinodon variegatus]|uniref:transmembrane protein 205 n=1 Tax=Cyprinodon variegatus TaxID=28743 RepID=UPI0007428263
HPRELLDWHESGQMGMFFVALIMAGLNAQWFGPAATEVMFQLRAVEEEHGLGNQIGLGSQREEYAKLKEKDPKYRASKKTFGLYHGLSNLCNLIGFICITTNLIYTALKLSTI